MLNRGGKQEVESAAFLFQCDSWLHLKIRLPDVPSVDFRLGDSPYFVLPEIDRYKQKNSRLASLTELLVHA